MSDFCVADCPDCRARFRLVWRIGKRKLKLTQVIHLSCPKCGIPFKTTPVQLVIFYAGAESFPLASIVDSTCLVM